MLLTIEQIKQFSEMHENKRSYDELAVLSGVSKNVIMRYIKNYKAGTIYRIMNHKDRLFLISEEVKTMTFSELKSHYESTFGVKIDVSTLNKYLRQLRIEYKKLSCTGPKLSDRDRREIEKILLGGFFVSFSDLADRYNTSQPTISGIAKSLGVKSNYNHSNYNPVSYTVALTSMKSGRFMSVKELSRASGLSLPRVKNAISSIACYPLKYNLEKKKIGKSVCYLVTDIVDDKMFTKKKQIRKAKQIRNENKAS